MCGMTIKDHQSGSEITKVDKSQVPKDMDEAEEYLERRLSCIFGSELFDRLAFFV